MPKFWEISKLLENPHFLAFAHLVIHFLGTIFSFGHNCAKRYADDDGPRKWSSLRQVRADFQTGTFFPRLVSGFESFIRRSGGWGGKSYRVRVCGMDKIACARNFFVSRQINGFR